MLRQYFPKEKGGGKERIRWRSHEPTRIEALSDTIFGFSISLLLFSLEVPKNSGELIDGMMAFLPFCFCFTIIFMIWYSQYKFFRHYGLHDMNTIVLNAILLVFVLFYIYPLKFMVNGWMLSNGSVLRRQDVLPMVFVYSGGLVIIYILFSLMYYNAYVLREELKLNPVEVFETITFICNCCLIIFTGIIVIIAAVIVYYIDIRYTFISFSLYGLQWPAFSIFGKYRAKLFHEKFGKTPMTGPELAPE